MTAPDRKLTVHVEEFTPRCSNTLRGFVTIIVPELKLRIIRDLSVHEKGSSRWVALPAKPQLGRDGAARRGEDGRPKYDPILEFTDSKTRNAFGHRVIEALLEFAPAALAADDEEAM
jgi:hypothetical protein